MNTRTALDSICTASAEYGRKAAHSTVILLRYCRIRASCPCKLCGKMPAQKKTSASNSGVNTAVGAASKSR